MLLGVRPQATFQALICDHTVGQCRQMISEQIDQLRNCTCLKPEACVSICFTLTANTRSYDIGLFVGDPLITIVIRGVGLDNISTANNMSKYVRAESWPGYVPVVHNIITNNCQTLVYATCCCSDRCVKITLQTSRLALPVKELI